MAKRLRKIAGEWYDISGGGSGGGIEDTTSSTPQSRVQGNWVNSPTTTVIDNLDSTSATDALSANQGHVLKGLVDGKLDKNTDITAGTSTKITYDEKGLVTAGASLAVEDIPTLPQSHISSLVTDLGGKADKPTSFVSGNLVEFDASGGLADSGTAASALADKADKVVGATLGNFAGLDSSGNLTDSNVGPTAISAKADKVASAVADNIATLDANGNYKDSGTSISSIGTDISGKADKVASATADNLASLDANGNLADSGTSVSAINTSINGKADKVASATADNIAALDATGNIKDGGTSISAINTSIDGKASKVTDAVAQNLAMFVSGGDIDDSGISTATISGKADKAVPSAAGNFAALNASGNLEDSGSSASSFDAAGTAATAVSTHDGSDEAHSALFTAAEFTGAKFNAKFDQTGSNVDLTITASGTIQLNTTPSGYTSQGVFDYFGTKTAVSALTPTTSPITAITSDTNEKGTWDGSSWSFAALSPTPANGMFADIINLLDYPITEGYNSGQVIWVDDGVNTAHWSVIPDKLNKYRVPIVNASSASTGSAYMATSAELPNTIPDGFIFVFVPNVNSNSESFTLAINGGLAMQIKRKDLRTGLATSPQPLLAGIPCTMGYHDDVMYQLDYAKASAEDLSGVVPVASGGTGLSASGTAGQALMVNASATALEWGDIPTSGIMRVNADSTSTTRNYTITNPELPNPLPNGYVFVFIPNVSSSNSGGLTPITITINSAAFTLYREVSLSAEHLSNRAEIVANHPYIIKVVNSTSLSLSEYALTDAQLGIYGEVPIANGGTGISDMGTAGQVLMVNAGATGLEYGDVQSEPSVPIFAADSGSTADAITITDTSFPSPIPNGYVFSLVHGLNNVESTGSASLTINGASTGTIIRLGVAGDGSGTNTSKPYYAYGVPMQLIRDNTNLRWVATEQPFVYANGISGVVPAGKGGTGIDTLTGKSGQYMRVNSGADGYELASVDIPPQEVPMFAADSSSTLSNIVIDDADFPASPPIGYTFSLTHSLTGTSTTYPTITANGTSVGTLTRRSIASGGSGDPSTVHPSFDAQFPVLLQKMTLNNLWVQVETPLVRASEVDGIVPIAKGGTALSAVGTAGQFLTVNSAANGLEYKTVKSKIFPVLVADNTSTNNVYTVTDTEVPNPVPDGYTFSFIPNLVTNNNAVTLSINGETPKYIKRGYSSGTQNTYNPVQMEPDIPYVLKYNGNLDMYMQVETPVSVPETAVPISMGGTGQSAVGSANSVLMTNSAAAATTWGYTIIYFETESEARDASVLSANANVLCVFPEV